MLVLARYALHRKVDLKINWLGRWGVWPVFSALFFALCGVHWLALACLYVGLVLTSGGDGPIRARWSRAGTTARLDLSLMNAMLRPPSRRL